MNIYYITIICTACSCSAFLIVRFVYEKMYKTGTTEKDYVPLQEFDL